ncbi:MAG: PDZ domain-containing protein [Thermoanaerobaculia bacterium]|nr:PDZ domain-containing protein [Thermoanaerobaculia bacterium]
MSNTTVRYELSFPQPHTHYIEVDAMIPTGGAAEVALSMAVWTPGSYLVREYAKCVECVTASTDAGQSLRVEKTRKNRWNVSTGGSASIRLRYRVYARTMATQGNWVSAEFAMLNGAPTFLAPVDRSGATFEIEVKPHPSWTRVISPLESAGTPTTFRASSYDELVDSPLYCGNASVYEFETGGAKHLLVNEGEGGLWDGAKAANDVEAIVSETQRMWGCVPYSRYVFFNMIVDGRGGLEHRNSCLLMTGRFKMRKRKEYVDWLSLVSHEFFHTWNIKRLRPAVLGPFDYENEVYTSDLWIAEGCTNFYEDVLLVRADLITRDEFFDRLGETIESLQTTPGRLVQSASAASFNAWISLYRRDENTPNVAISYYVKGTVIAFLLDAAIRAATNGTKSLDDVMLAAWQRFSGERGFESHEFRALASEIAGRDLAPFFARAVDSTDELDYGGALGWYGLRFKSKNGDAKKDDEPKGWLGVVTSDKAGRLVVDEVRRDTPAHAAGVNAEDEIIAIDDYRVTAAGWEERLSYYPPGSAASLLVARRGKLERLPVVFGRKPDAPWRLEVLPEPTDAQRAHLDGLLGAAK